MKYRKKPVVIEAVQLTEDVFKEPSMGTIRRFMAASQAVLRLPDGIEVATLEGNMKANINDWIICGVNGEYYPCKPDIFEKTYQPADESIEEQPGEKDAISFAEWICIEGYRRSMTQGWYLLDEDEENDKGFFTTEQLYNIYKNRPQ